MSVTNFYCEQSPSGIWFTVQKKSIIREIFVVCANSKSLRLFCPRLWRGAAKLVEHSVEGNHFLNILFVLGLTVTTKVVSSSNAWFC